MSRGRGTRPRRGSEKLSSEWSSLPPHLAMKLIPSNRFVPRYFDKDISRGIPTLTADGWAAVEEEMKETSSHAIHGTRGAKMVL